MQQRKILIVDDESGLRELVRINLEHEGYGVIQAENGIQGLEAVREGQPDLVIMDVMMPEMDGWEACKKLREFSPVPVLMLTARVQSQDIVTGLDSGADDYLLKPFNMDELMARVRALLRRGVAPAAQAGNGDHSRPLVYKHIEVDPARRRVRVGTRDVDLTFNEFELLRVLLSNPGIVFSREALLSKVWKDETFVTVRSVDTLVKRIRKKIEQDSASPSVILTVWGAGYKAADV